VPLRFQAGDKWEYSNSGYVALAEIIRSVAGQPWTEYLQQKIFAPAGMNATLPTNTTASVPNRALGYTGDDNQRKADEWRALRASGAFLSTVLDLAKWDALLYTDRILSDTARRQMWTAVRLNDGKTAPYGLGWHVESLRGRLKIWHGGGLPGFTSHFARFVDDGLSVVVLTNGDDGDVGSIANGVAALYLPSRSRN
jgi:CubicO group peptidase (beta-lactamase class C family)